VVDNMAAYGTSDRGEVGKGPEPARNVTTNSLGSKPISNEPYGTSDRDEVGKGPEPEIKYNGPAQVKEIDAQIKSLITSAGEEADAVEAKYNRSDVANKFVDLAPPVDTTSSTIQTEDQDMASQMARFRAADAITPQQRIDSLSNIRSDSLIANEFDKHESNSYDALYAYAEQFDHKKGKSKFIGEKITKKTLRELVEFSRASSEYGKWVKPKLPPDSEAAKKGLTSTPLGKFQIVGSTLRGLIDNYGWDLNTVFDKKTQDQMYLQLANEVMNVPFGSMPTQAQANKLQGKFEGFKNITPSEMSNLAIETQRMIQRIKQTDPNFFTKLKKVVSFRSPFPKKRPTQ